MLLVAAASCRRAEFDKELAIDEFEGAFEGGFRFRLFELFESGFGRFVRVGVENVEETGLDNGFWFELELFEPGFWMLELESGLLEPGFWFESGFWRLEPGF